MFFGGDVFGVASGQGVSRSGLPVLSVLSWLSVFGYSVRRCDGLPVAGVRFRYLWQAFPFLAFVRSSSFIACRYGLILSARI